MKKILSNGLLIFLLLVFNNSVFGQFQDIDIQKRNFFKGKILLVASLDPTTASIMMYRKEGRAVEENYKQGVANYNEIFKRATQSAWTYGKGVEFVNQAKLKEYITKNSSKYIVLNYVAREGTFNEALLGEYYGNDVSYNTELRKKSKEEGFGIFEFQIIKNRQLETIFQVNNPVMYPSESDVEFALKTTIAQLQKYVKNTKYEFDFYKTEYKTEGKLWKDKTLLLDPAQVVEGASLDEISKELGISVELLEFEEVEAAILRADTNYLIVRFTPFEEFPLKQRNKILGIGATISNAGTGRIYQFAKVTRMDYGKFATLMSDKEAKSLKIKL